MKDTNEFETIYCEQRNQIPAIAENLETIIAIIANNKNCRLVYRNICDDLTSLYIFRSGKIVREVKAMNYSEVLGVTLKDFWI